VYWLNLLSNLIKIEMRFLAKIAILCIWKPHKSGFRDCYGSRETFRFNIYHIKSLYFQWKPWGTPHAFWSIFGHVFFWPKKLSKGVRKLRLLKYNCLASFRWLTKAYISRYEGLKAVKFGYVLFYKVYLHGINHICGSWNLLERQFCSLCNV